MVLLMEILSLMSLFRLKIKLNMNAKKSMAIRALSSEINGNELTSKIAKEGGKNKLNPINNFVPVFKLMNAITVKTSIISIFKNII